LKTTKEIRRAECAKQSARFFYYSELKRYERKKSFIGHQYILINILTFKPKVKRKA